MNNTTINIGPYSLKSPLVLSPMAGITDLPFRQICRSYGAGLAISEMTASNPALEKHPRTIARRQLTGETEPRSVQIVGTDPQQMAIAAQLNADNGAQIIDINMGCPAKKVCNVAAGSALLRDEPLVEKILQAVVNAVDVPVTLKIRTGWDKDSKNAVKIATIAEQSGIQALAIHGRTRACKYKGEAEYETIKAVKESIHIPIFANGDITTPEKAKAVLDSTQADGLYIGRGAQGQPWIFRDILHFLKHGTHAPTLPMDEKREVMFDHIRALHTFYGELMGVKIARKHIGWYIDHIAPELKPLLKKAYSFNSGEEQLAFLEQIFYPLEKTASVSNESFPTQTAI